jgi:hypothetical protein
VSAGWVEANQRWLVAQLACLRLRLQGADGEPLAAARAELDVARAALPAPGALDRLAELFALSPFERELLLLCAGVEMDARIAAACAETTGRSAASFSLALSVLEQPHWSALTPGRPLRRWRLLEVEAGALSSAALRIDERVLHELAGIGLLDARLQPLLRPVELPELAAPSQRQRAEALVALARAGSMPSLTVQLVGDDPAGAEDVAALAAAQLGQRLLAIRAEDLPAAAVDLETLATLWQREAVLGGAALLVQGADAASAAAAFAERVETPLFLAVRDALVLRRPALVQDVPRPDATEQKQLWELALGTMAGALNGALDGVAAQFRLSAQAIAESGRRVGQRVAAGDSPAGALWSVCTRSGRRGLDGLAQRLAAAAGWDDLVLPDAQLASLRQLAMHVRRRTQVYESWGFGRNGARGLGVSALFAGESGTGKTLAAEVLAAELHLDLYRIDLSAVVSKYIGETEKNLRRVFDAAEDGGAVLLFDEADALFGKRSEVRDSHDRYANIEVSYLLQRMEAYRGLAILTTNLKSALDPAFQRRLRFIVHFPFPDAGQREAIWQRAIPPGAPTAGLDVRKLARLHVTGGGIRNIALNAAFLAADTGEPIGMGHLLAAARAESGKAGWPLSEAETRGWA